MFRALLPAFPDRLPAGTKAMMAQAGFGGRDVAAGEYFCFYETFAGGYGGRSASDGPDAVQAHGQNTENAPIEETELNYPVRIPRYELIEDSEGAGPLPRRPRAAARLPLRPPDDLHDPRRPRQVRPARASFGGLAGRKAEYVLDPRTAPRRGSSSKTTVELEPGDVVSCRTCGGGGYGPPDERDPALVARDVREGKVERRAGARRLPRRRRRGRRRRRRRRRASCGERA